MGNIKLLKKEILWNVLLDDRKYTVIKEFYLSGKLMRVKYFASDGSLVEDERADILENFID